MKTLIVNGLVYRNDKAALEPLDVLTEDGKISALAHRGELEAKEDVCLFDASGYAIYPGLVDVHTHGRVCHDFIDADNAALHEMARSYAKHGVTTVMPTLASAPYERMVEQAKVINEFSPDEDEAELYGVHFEGRYLNPKRKGAHAQELLAPLDPRELEEPALKALKAFHISAAFELDETGEFAKRAEEIGATLAWGHTDASYEQVMSHKGNITAFTHLFNAMPPLHHRNGGAVAACLNGEGIAELICDGLHISPEMVELTYKVKGMEGISLISDSMEATDAPDGEYSIAGNPVTVKDGQARLCDGTLAGSTLNLDRAVELFRKFCSIDRNRAILAASQVPAKEVGIFDFCGSIDVGKRADMLFLDANREEFEIEKIMLRGKFIK